MSKLIGTNPNQVPSNADLGTAAFMDKKDFLLSRGSEMSAIDAVISKTAVDVFIYDTAKDSDGGAWRKRTQDTSWYNEKLNTPIRGSRQEFPSVAVIVATAASGGESEVIIYDADDPTLPMWMELSARGNSDTQGPTTLGWYTSGTPLLTAVTALNGIVGVVGDGGLRQVKFVSDSFRLAYTTNSYITHVNIAQREIKDVINEGSSGTGGDIIVWYESGDVDMKVFPNAPIDVSTGLPTPTIAVGTNKGLSIIKDDGTVINRSTSFVNSSNPGGVRDISFDNNSGYWYTNSHYPPTTGNVESHAAVVGHSNSISTTGAIASSDSQIYGELMMAIGSDDGGNTTHWSSTTLPGVWMNHGGDSTRANAAPMEITPNGDFANQYGLHKFLPNYSDHSASAVAYITSDYNTGYMIGKTKLAILSDTNSYINTYDYVEGYGNFTAGSEWTANTGWSTSGNVATKTGGTGSNYISKNIGRPLLAGKYYRAEFDLLSGSGTGVQLVNRHGSGVPKPFTTATNVDVAFFQGQGNKYYAIWQQSSLNLGLISLYAGSAVSLDNLKVYEIDTLDRSIRGNPILNIGDSLIKTPVASGAELMGYSGFTAYDGLAQPYNSSLEPGTGDYSFMIWFKTDPTTAEQTIVRRFGNPTVTGGMLMRILGTSSLLSWYTRDTSSTVGVVNSTTAVDDGQWHHAVGVRDGNRAKLYVDGVEVGDVSTSANSHDVGTTGQLLIGIENTVNTHTYANPASVSTLALARYALSAPSAEQIAKIYNDEKHLFQENAKATLYGTSDAVTGLAHDDDTELLHVGTSAGRSDFQGLRRINNTTRAIATAISAVDGFIVEE